MKKKMIVILALLSAFILTSCYNVNESMEEENANSYVEDAEYYKAYETKSKVDSNYFQSFELSNCVNDCKDPGKIIRNEYINDTLYLKLGHWFNCSLGIPYYANVTPSESGDSLYFSIRGTSGVHEECDCYFYVSCVITNLKKQPKGIMINKKEIDYYPSYIEQSNNSDMFIEEEEAPEKVDTLKDGTIKYFYYGGRTKEVSPDGTVKEIF